MGAAAGGASCHGRLFSQQSKPAAASWRGTCLSGGRSKIPTPVLSRRWNKVSNGNELNAWCNAMIFDAHLTKQPGLVARSDFLSRDLPLHNFHARTGEMGEMVTQGFKLNLNEAKCLASVHDLQCQKTCTGHSQRRLVQRHAFRRVNFHASTLEMGQNRASS